MQIGKCGTVEEDGAVWWIMSRLVDKPDKEKDNDEEIPAQEIPNPILRHRPKTRTSPPSAHARGDWPCMQAGRQQSSSTSASLPEEKEEKDEDDYPLRKKKKKKKKHPTSSPPLLLLLLLCFSVPSPELLFPSKHWPKKETKTPMPKKPSSLFSLPHKPEQKSSQISLTKSCLYFRPHMYYNHGRDGQTDRASERARTRR